MTNLSLWRLGLRWLRLKPLTLVWIVGLAAGQLVSILLIAQVFQSALMVDAGAHQILWRALRMIALGLASSAGLFLSRVASACIANNTARHLRVELLDLLYTRAYAYYARSNTRGRLIENLMLRLRSAQARRENAPTTLIISHDMGLARQADHLYILPEGRLMASRSPAALAEPLMRHE